MKRKIKVTATVEMTVWITESVNGDKEIDDVEEVTEIIDWEEK